MIDMLAEAREAQWTSLAFMGPDAIKVLAPAKVNLFLGIGARRQDGYHDAVNVMHALALHDVLYMNVADADAEESGAANVEANTTASTNAKVDKAAAANSTAADAIAVGGPADNLVVTIDMSDKCGCGIACADAGENLAFKAIDMLAHEIGYSRDEKVDIRIEKHIPSQAGLGGGSADAAAALIGAAHFWGVAPDGETLRSVAMRLGADVAFFLEGACALFTGIGERFERHLTPMKLPVVLVKPDGGVPTAAAYAEFDAHPTPAPAALEAQAEDAAQAWEVPLFNSLTEAAENLLPELGAIRMWLCAQDGVEAALLSGSGSATFAICDTYATALRIAAVAGAQGWWARATTFSSLRAAKVG